jgi:hypothetical protein
MKSLEQVIIVVATIFVTWFVVANFICGKKNREHMSGYGTISGLAYNNNDIHCYKGNAMGSSSPFCTSTGYVLT